MSFDIIDILKSFISLAITLLPILLVMAPIFLIILCIKKKVRIKLRTFKGKGFRPERGNFGLYTYCGKQGLTEKVKHTHLLSI